MALATLGLLLAAAAYPLRWGTGEYIGIVLAAVALGMHFQRRLRR